MGLSILITWHQLLRFLPVKLFLIVWSQYVIAVCGKFPTHWNSKIPHLHFFCSAVEQGWAILHCCATSNSTNDAFSSSQIPHIFMLSLSTRGRRDFERAISITWFSSFKNKKALPYKPNDKIDRLIITRFCMMVYYLFSECFWRMASLPLF